MKSKSKDKEKERSDAFRALRDELEEKILETMPEEGVRPEDAQPGLEQTEETFEVSSQDARRIIEALLFASNKPLMVKEIRRIVKGLKPSEVQKIVEELGAEYDRENRSFQIREIAGGYEISSRTCYSGWIRKLEAQKRSRQASQSALETLAIMAYKQPVTRQEIEELRGVSASGVVATLLDRGLIGIVGRKEVPGRPFLYGTTERFLEHFGLPSLDEMPQIAEIRELVEKAVPRDELLKQISPEEAAAAEAEEEAEKNKETTAQAAQRLADEREKTNVALEEAEAAAAAVQKAADAAEATSKQAMRALQSAFSDGDDDEDVSSDEQAESAATEAVEPVNEVKEDDRLESKESTLEAVAEETAADIPNEEREEIGEEESSGEKEASGEPSVTQEENRQAR